MSEIRQGQDTFQDAITRFRNRSIRTYVGHCLTFRGQILQDGEFGVQSGWDTATNEFMLEHLVKLDFLRRKITHNPTDVDIKTLIERARDLNVSHPDDIDEILGPIDGIVHERLATNRSCGDQNPKRDPTKTTGHETLHICLD